MKKDLDNKIIQAGMFNDKASDMERQKRLEDLIRKDYADDEEGDEESSENENAPDITGASYGSDFEFNY